MDLEILDLISQTRVEIQDIRNKYNTALYDSSLIMAMNKSLTIQEPQHKVHAVYVKLIKNFVLSLLNLKILQDLYTLMYF